MYYHNGFPPQDVRKSQSNHALSSMQSGYNTSPSTSTIPIDYAQPPPIVDYTQPPPIVHYTQPPPTQLFPNSQTYPLYQLPSYNVSVSHSHNVPQYSHPCSASSLHPRNLPSHPPQPLFNPNHHSISSQCYPQYSLNSSPLDSMSPSHHLYSVPPSQDYHGDSNFSSFSSSNLVAPPHQYIHPVDPPQHPQPPPPPPPPKLLPPPKPLLPELVSTKKYDDISVRSLFKRPILKINPLKKITLATKDSSSESSPERLQILKRVSGSASVAPLPLSSSSSSSFSTSAPPFVPRCTNTKAELNPNAPAFVPIQSAQDEPLLMDEHGKEVDKIWIEVNKQILEKNKNTIDELNRRVAELEEEKKKMAEKDALREMDMQRMNGTRADEEKKNHQTIAQLQSQMREKDEKIEWKEQTISQICLESEKKSEELNRIRRTYDSEMENMKTRYREATSIAIDERRAKERVTEMAERREQEVKKEKLERKTACAKEAVIQCTSIINRLAVDAEAEVMASLFVDLRKKWIDHHSILNQYLEALQRGEWMDVDVALSLKEPSMPREADELVKECYVWRYQTMHILSFRLATIVKKCLIDHKRHYEDVYIIGIIQKWMKIHKDPAKITASVTQVANMVAQAMGDAPLMPPKYVNVAVEVPPPPSASPSSRVVPLSPLQTPPPRKTSGIERAEPKGWKKASDKVRQVDMRDHECSICLEDTEGGDISYCETFSCNEPYHNECLDRYWKTGGRNCPRCRTPMPPRDAFPALG